GLVPRGSHMIQQIHFYDIPRNRDEDDRTWNPNTSKTRLTLTYKRLPYKTIWVEYPDIERVCKEIGAEPSAFGLLKEGKPYYSLPVIHDPNTGTTISDSIRIARYLDKTYPDTPAVIPAELEAFHAVFEDAFWDTIFMPLFPFLVPAACPQLNPRSEAYFRETREGKFGSILGGKMENWAPTGPVRDDRWKALQAGFTKMAGWLSADGQERPFFMGEKLCYTDIVVGAWLISVKKVFGSDHPEWLQVEKWDGGRWSRLVQVVENF
nr:Chain A, Glutathione S-transferase [Gelatoporia subvermispora B]6J3H_B Chain B, Glutathione S-transferase [Gelatoporia subvermispora B]6J3H_C Chain C, Glutathione S-transferase [Gelatoporia subvermispora B]6J3H_D Chain D, Glutathione S-transferase [Gelatoporia subvermispora B]